MNVTAASKFRLINVMFLLSLVSRNDPGEELLHKSTHAESEVIYAGEKIMLHCCHSGIFPAFLPTAIICNTKFTMSILGSLQCGHVLLVFTGVDSVRDVHANIAHAISYLRAAEVNHDDSFAFVTFSSVILVG